MVVGREEKNSGSQRGIVKSFPSSLSLSLCMSFSAKLCERKKWNFLLLPFQLEAPYYCIAGQLSKLSIFSIFILLFNAKKGGDSAEKRGETSVGGKLGGLKEFLAWFMYYVYYHCHSERVRQKKDQL